MLNQQGFERVFTVLTDASGAFVHTFKPTITDAGLFKVSAVHPDITDRPEQKAFTINRVTVSPSGGLQRRGRGGGPPWWRAALRRNPRVRGAGDGVCGVAVRPHAYCDQTLIRGRLRQNDQLPCTSSRLRLAGSLCGGVRSSR